MSSVCNSKENILRSIGIKKGFGSDNRKRLHCYSVLLGCGDIELYRKSDKYKHDSLKYLNSYSDQIAKDLKRNVYTRWSQTSQHSTARIQHDLVQIEKLINIVFTEYPHLQYIQSFDSIFSLFYVLSEGNLFVAKKIIVSYFHIFKADLIPKTDHFGYFQSKTILALIHKYDSRFYEWFQTKIMADIELEGELCGVVFALKWYLSWFCHSAITDLDDVLRIYDFMISSQNKAIAIYMIVAVLLINKDRIMSQVKDYTELLLFMEHNMVYNVKEMIVKCCDILEYEHKANYVQKMWSMLADKFRN
eukprot:802_1